MRLNYLRLALALCFFFTVTASVAAHAQNDVALSFYGAFNSTTNYNIGLEHQTSANAAGGIFEFRHISNPFVGYEATYSFNRANQVYSYTGPTPAGSGSGPFLAAVSANAHEITGDWIFSVPVGSFRPFALVGAGLLLNEPVSGQSQTTSSTQAVYIYGAGLDWKLVPHIGLRFQYRGNVHRAADITRAFGSDNAFMHTAEPMIGAYFQF
jgi:opacity protein-like surface antigen